MKYPPNIIDIGHHHNALSPGQNPVQKRAGYWVAQCPRCGKVLSSVSYAQQPVFAEKPAKWKKPAKWRGNHTITSRKQARDAMIQHLRRHQACVPPPPPPEPWAY